MGESRKPPETAQEKPKRAAIYLRVSTQYQVDKDSLPMQRQDLIAYCELVLDIHDYVIFEDAGYSGKNTDRPDYQKMMAQIREGLFTHLVVWKIDRISRNLLDFASMYEELKELGVTFVSKNEQFDTSSAMGEAMLKIILVFAELERGMTSERVQATMINRATNGIWNGGKIPFGYDYDKETHIFTIDQEEAKVVEYIFSLYEEIHSTVRVAQRMNDEGYKSRYGNPFSSVTIILLLRNPWYKGTYRYNYYKIPGKRTKKDPSEWIFVDNHHPAIIDPDRFDRIQVMLDNNVRFRNTPGRNVMGKHVHIFAGLLWCAECGSAFTSSPGKLHASGYRSSKYGCPGVTRENKCGAKYTSDPVIGEFVLNYILNIINAQKEFDQIKTPAELQKRLLSGSTFSDVDHIEKDGLNALFNMLSQYTGADTVLLDRPKPKAKVDPELDRLKKEKKKQERALDRLNHIYLYSDDSMSDREYIVRKQEITDELEEINEAMGIISQEAWVQTMSDDDFLAAASSFIINQELQDRKYIYFQRLAEETDPAVLKSFFQSIIDSIMLRRGKIETIVFKNGLSHTFLYKNSAET